MVVDCGRQAAHALACRRRCHFAGVQAAETGTCACPGRSVLTLTRRGGGGGADERSLCSLVWRCLVLRCLVVATLFFPFFTTALLGPVTPLATTCRFLEVRQV